MRTAVIVMAVALCARAGVGSAQDVRGEVRVRGIPVSGAVVFLERVGDKVPAPAPLRGRLDQRNLAFSPRVLVVPPGSTVEFPNSDAVMHNVFHPGEGTAAFDLGTYSSSEAKTFRFDQEGLFVVLCHVHPEMVGYIAVVPSALHAVTADDGRFVLAGVGPGEYRVHVWHRRVQDPVLPLSVTKGGVAEPLLLNLSRRAKRGLDQ